MPELSRILHVEDDPSIQAVAKVALEAVGGFRVLSCSCGQDALDQVQGFAPDFILLDVMMPGMDGPQTLAKIAQLVDIGRIPVAFMTAKVQPAAIEHYRGLGLRSNATGRPGSTDMEQCSWLNRTPRPANCSANCSCSANNSPSAWRRNCRNWPARCNCCKPATSRRNCSNCAACAISCTNWRARPAPSASPASASAPMNSSNRPSTGWRACA
ncbi:Alkaline phosphatase synthesis transcriptional regulatory protein PhoP [compost metagenome]